MLENHQLMNRVRPLYDAYADCIDQEQYDQWPEFFDDDCFYQITSFESHRKNLPIGIIQCTSKGMLIDRINSMRRANIFEPQRYRHLLGPLHVERNAEGKLVARMGFAVVRILASGECMLFLSGAYHDELSEQGEALRFSRKIVVLDSSRIDTLLVVPV